MDEDKYEDVDEEHVDEIANVELETLVTEVVEEFGEPHTHVDDEF